jgi:hypothetical protein
MRALLAQGFDPLGVFDEGLLFTNAQMMNDGRVPYRDFYSIYPPGIFQIVRGAMALSGSPIWTVRCLTFLVRVASAVLAARLVGRARGETFCVATAAAVLLLQVNLGLTAYAYTFAVLLCLAITATWPAPDAPTWRRVCSGALLGCLSYLRHDMFVYFAAILFAAELISRFLRRRFALVANGRELLEVAGGAAAVVFLLWLPVLAKTGLSRPLHDMFLDLGEVMPARVLPVPPLLVQVWSAPLNMHLPALLGEPLRLQLLVSTICIAAASYGSARTLFGRQASPRAPVALICTAFALVTIPQTMGRTDHWHTAFGLPLVFAAGLSILGKRTAQAFALLGFLPWLTEAPKFITGAEVLRLLRANDSMFLSPERALVRDFVRTQAKSGEPILVCCNDHRRVIFSPMDVYYWAHRPGATRYMQFDPGLTTTEKGQSEMIADLRRTKPRLVLRFADCVWDEPNKSMIPGATLLDEYLRTTYVPSEVVGSFTVWRRKAGG